MAKSIFLEDDVETLLKIRLSKEYDNISYSGKERKRLWDNINFQLGSLYSAENIKEKYRALMKYYVRKKREGDRRWKYYELIEELLEKREMRLGQKKEEKRFMKRINLSKINTTKKKENNFIDDLKKLRVAIKKIKNKIDEIINKYN